MGDTKIQMDSKSTKHQKSEFTMRVGKHEATVRFEVFNTIFHCGGFPPSQDNVLEMILQTSEGKSCITYQIM